VETIAVRVDQVRLSEADASAMCDGLTLWQHCGWTNCARIAAAWREAVRGDNGCGAGARPSVRAVERFDIAEDWYRGTALEDILGACGRVNDDRVYRTLDRLLRTSEDEQHLSSDWRAICTGLRPCLYDVPARISRTGLEIRRQSGHSRDHRPDCKQCASPWW